MPYKVEKWNRPYPPNPAKLRLELEAEGYTVAHWCDRPEIFYSLHKHSDDQSHWIISGSLEITLRGGGTFCLERGDRDLMPAETYHSARVVGEEPVVYLIGSKQSTIDRAAARESEFDALLGFAAMMQASDAVQGDTEDDAQEEPEEEA
ncbi:MAG: cupin domain-containing protein [Acidobacteria bacterium]|nr:cupin domain-containing protein [Acidobacteriota bacterium]